MLTTKEQLRYSRQTMLKNIGESGQLKLQQAKVLIVGLGGLGCPVSVYLASAGIGTLLLCDDDDIELTNLQRQILFTESDIGQNKAECAKDKLLALNHHCDIEVIDERLDEELAQYHIPDADIVIDCTDNIATRYLLNKLCYQYDVPLVIGAATGFDGQTMLVDPKQNSACYECLFPNTTSNNAESEGGNCQTLGILGPVLAIVGGMQAMTALKYLTNNQTTINQLLMFDGTSQTWQPFKLNKQAYCQVCQN